MEIPQLFLDWIFELANDLPEIPPVEAIGFLVLLYVGIEINRMSKPGF